MTEPGIFISYRREDSAGDAGRLADHLHQRFGAARVFLDIDISTLDWAFDDYAGKDEARRRLRRYYAALLHARAGRVSQAVEELRRLDRETVNAPGSLRNAVQAALKRLASS